MSTQMQQRTILAMGEALRTEERVVEGLRAMLSPRHSQSSRTMQGAATRANFLSLLATSDAPRGFFLARSYLHAAGLELDGGWSISALPGGSGPADSRRLLTVSGGSIEMFYLCIDKKAGRLMEWGIRLSSEEARALALPTDGAWTWEHVSGRGTYIAGATTESFVELLASPGVAEAVRGTASRRTTGRRRTWHNPWLAQALISPAQDDTGDGTTGEAGGEDDFFERRYAEGIRRQRLHQKPLREAALKKYPVSCAYCGLDVAAVLDVAHLEADSLGGDASTANVRILCANHHRAFDTGLLRWDEDSETFRPVGEGSMVGPHPVPS